MSSSNRCSTTTPSWMKVTIKLTIGQHVRRIPVSRILLQGQKSPMKTNDDGSSQSPSIELLRQLALSFHWEEQQLQKKQSSSPMGSVEEEYQVVFTYQDEEGDTIYVSSDIELMEALQYSSSEEEDKISFLRVTANVTPLSEILEQSFFDQDTSQTKAAAKEKDEVLESLLLSEQASPSSLSSPTASRSESTEECAFRQATESHHFTNQTIQSKKKDENESMTSTAAAMLNHHEQVKRSTSLSGEDDDHKPSTSEKTNEERAHATSNHGRSSSTNNSNGGGGGGVANHILSKAEEIVLCLRKEVEEVATAAAAAAPTDIRPPPCIRKLQRKFSAAKQREWELERERLKKHYPKPNGDDDEDTVASDTSGTAGVAAAAAEATGGVCGVASPESKNENDKKAATAGTTKKAATSSSSSSFDPRFVHPRHQCDMCHVFPIRGFRWRAVRPKQPATNDKDDATPVAADAAADAATTKKTKPEYVEMNFDLCHRCYVTWREQKDDVVDARSSKRFSSIHNMKLPDGVKFRPVQLELDRLYHLKRHSHQERLRQEGKNVHLDTFMRELNSKSSHVAQVVMRALNDLPKEAKSRARFGYQRGVGVRGGRYCGRNGSGGRRSGGPRDDEFYIDLVHCPEVNEGILKSLSQLSQKREDAKRAAASGTEPITVEVEATVLDEPLISEDPETAAAAGANANPTTTTLSLEDGSTLVATAVSGLDCGTHDASQCALVDVVVPTKTTDDEEEDHLAQSSLTFGSSATNTREVVVVPPPPPVSSVVHSSRNGDEPSAMTADDNEEEETNASSHSRSEEKDEGDDDDDVDNKDEEPVTIVSSVASSRATDHASDASAVVPPTEEMLQLSLGASALNDSVLLGMGNSSLTLPSSSSSSMYHSAVEGSRNSTDNSSTVEAADAAETSPTKTDETTTNTSSDKNTSDVVTETRKNSETNDDSKTEQEVDSNNKKDDRKNNEHVDNNNTTNVDGATTTIDMSTVGCDDDDLESIEEQEETAAVEPVADDYKAIVVLSDDDADAAWILEDNDDEEEEEEVNNKSDDEDDKAVVVVDREEEEENNSNDDNNDLPILEGYPSSADESSASETADDWDLLDSSSDDDDSDSEIFARATQSIGSSLFSQGSGGNQK